MPTTRRAGHPARGADRVIARLHVGTVASQAGEQLAALAVAVYAYRVGGAAAVGLVAVVQMVPAALLGPFTSLLGDRYRRERVVVLCDAVRAAAAAGAAAATALQAPFAVVCLLLAVVAVVSGVFHPAHTALLPLVARSVVELTRATARTSLLRSSVSLLAPAAAGAVLLRATETTVLACAALSFAAAGAAVRRVPRTDAVRAAPPMASAGRALQQGVRAAGGDPGTRLVLGLLLAHSTVRGAVGVLVVVLPLELLDQGSSSVGFVASLVGLGGLLGAVGLAHVAPRRSPAGPLTFGMALTGLPLAVAAAVDAAPVVLAALALVGGGLTIVGTSVTTLLVRAVRDDVLARVLGLLGTVRAAGVALGAGATPLLVAAAGLRWTLALTGLGLVVVLLAARRGLRELDRCTRVPPQELALLRAAVVFAPLPAVALERLAAKLDRVVVLPGTAVVDEGDEADCVYVVAAGRLVVEAREGGGVVDSISAGEVFGEMALLHDARRNATVRAVTVCELHRLTRDEFLAAVTGSPESSLRTSDLVAARLEHRRGVVGRSGP